MLIWFNAFRDLPVADHQTVRAKTAARPSPAAAMTYGLETAVVIFHSQQLETLALGPSKIFQLQKYLRDKQPKYSGVTAFTPVGSGGDTLLNFCAMR